jgi:hypothetical protein
VKTEEVIKMKVTIARLNLICMSLICISLIFITISSATIDPGTIVGLWLFDDGTGDTAKDSSGHGNDGKLMEGPKWVAGKFRKALEFDNKGTYIDCGNDKSFDVNSFTLAAWVFPTSIDASTHEMIMGKGWSGTERSYYLSIFQGKAFVSFRNPDNTAQADVQGNTLLDKSTWYHIVGTHDRASKTVAIYVDGGKENEKVFDHDVMVTPKTVLIGNLGDHTLFFGGKIDEVAIFSVALKEDDINNIMTNGMADVSPAGKLAGVWGDIKSH